MVLGWLQRRQRYRILMVAANGMPLRAQLADTALKRMIGLMYRGRMGPREAMLFIFPREGYHSIWMYNMRFPIDVLWLDRSLRIVHVEEKLQPCSSVLRCRTYSPSRPALYVLEGRSGLAMANRLRVGMRLSLGQTKGKGGLSPSPPVHL